MDSRHGSQRHTIWLKFMISIWLLVLGSQQNNLNHWARNARNLYLCILNFAINLYWDRIDCKNMSSTPIAIYITPMCLSIAFQYHKLEPVLMTWNLNVDGIHDPEPSQTKDCSCCLEIEDEEHFITKCQINADERRNLYTKLSSSTQLFGILVTTTSSYFSCPAKTDRY